MASKNFTFFSNWVNAELLRDWPKDEPECLAFIPFISKARDDFNHRAFGRAAKIPETATRQNTECLDYLKVIQAELITMGHMIPKGDSNTPSGADEEKPVVGKECEFTSHERADYERLKNEVVRLNEELRSANDALKRFGKMEEYLAEFGVLPR